VTRLLVDVGATVSAGAALLVIEAMKMEHVVAAPDGGVVAELRVEVGSQVEAGAVVVVIRPVDGDA
jgi:propionyl-CoA carboxylase alpha chain